MIEFDRVRVHGTGLKEPSFRRVLRLDPAGIALYSFALPELVFSWRGGLLSKHPKMPNAHIDADDLRELRDRFVRRGAHDVPTPATAPVATSCEKYSTIDHTRPVAPPLGSASVDAAPSPDPGARPKPPAQHEPGSIVRSERSPSATLYDPRLSYTANQSIFHRSFGEGVVSQVEGDRIVVIFPTGARTLQNGLVRPTAPPPRPPAMARTR